MVTRQSMDPNGVAHFGSGSLDETGLVHHKTIAGLVKAAAAGSINALVVDARSSDDFFRGHALLRALYDDPRRPRRLLHPSRVLALIATSDVEAAFTLGRYGIAGVLEERALGELPLRLRRILESPPDASPLATPALAAPSLDPPRGAGREPAADGDDRLPALAADAGRARALRARVARARAPKHRLRGRRHADRGDGRRGADVPDEPGRQSGRDAHGAVHRLVRVLSRPAPHAVRQRDEFGVDRRARRAYAARHEHPANG